MPIMYISRDGYTGAKMTAFLDALKFLTGTMGKDMLKLILKLIEEPPPHLDIIHARHL